MKWYWVVLIIIGVLYLFLRVSVSTSWMKTLNSVISQFVAASTQYPREDISFWYTTTANNRYPMVLSGIRRELHSRMFSLLTFRSTFLFPDDNDYPLLSLLKRDTLPSLILFCLLVEQNIKVGNRSDLGSVYSEIEKEVRRQGFARYC